MSAADFIYSLEDASGETSLADSNSIMLVG